MCGYIGKILEQIDKENIYGSNKRIICRGPDDKNFINFNLNQFNCSFILTDYQYLIYQHQLTNQWNHIVSYQLLCLMVKFIIMII